MIPFLLIFVLLLVSAVISLACLWDLQRRQSCIQRVEIADLERELSNLRDIHASKTAEASKRIKELEGQLAQADQNAFASSSKILELQGDLTEAEDNRNALLNLNAELKKDLDLETGACKELDAQIKVLGQELQGAHEWINELMGRLERVRTECDRPYQMNQLPTGSDFGTNT